MIYGVFIIESLDIDEYHDASMLYQILRLSNTKCEYRKVTCMRSFEQIISEFDDSNFRYLHLSCHGSQQGLQIGDEFIANYQIGSFLEGRIKNKRVFLSSCEAGNRSLASEILKHGGYSLIGSPVEIAFDKAALCWASFFHVIQKLDKNKMKRKNIKSALEAIVDLFNVPIDYYSFIAESRTNKLRRLQLRPYERNDSRIMNII